MNSIIENVRQGLLQSQRNIPTHRSVEIDYSPIFLRVLIKRETGRVWTGDDLNFEEYGFANMDDRLADDIGTVFDTLRSNGISPRLHNDGSVTMKVIGKQPE